MSNTRISLRQWLWRAFTQNALLPVLLVETALIAVYLLSNSAIRDGHIEHLRNAARADLQATVDAEARLLNQQLAELESLVELYRNRTTWALAQPAATTPDNLGLTADGVRYSLRDDGQPAVFYSASTPPARQDLQKITRLGEIAPMMDAIKEHQAEIAAIYFNSWDSLNYIYPWFDTAAQYPHDMRIPQFNFYYLADARHNPQRQVVWTDVYLDPAGQGWMMSAIAPVYRGDFLEGVVGLDITVSQMLKDIAALQVPWNGYALLIDEHHNIMALPEAGQRDLGLRELTRHTYTAAISSEQLKPEEFNLARHPETQALNAALMRQDKQGVVQLSLGGKPHLVAWQTLPLTGWHLVVAAPEEQLFAETNALAGHYRQIGYLLIGGLLLFYLAFISLLWLRLRRLSVELHQPILAVNRMMTEIGQGRWHPQPPQTRIEELAQMAEQARGMGEELASSEARRQQAGERLELVMESATEALWEHDLRNDTLLLRGRFCEHFGIAAETRGQTFRQRVHPDDIERLRALGELVRQGQNDHLTCELRVADADGRYHWLLSQGRVLTRDPQSGDALFTAGTFVDIDALKQTEDDLRQATLRAEAANVAKSRFLSSVSHELRTPLNAILGFAQLLRMQQPRPGQARDGIDEIIEAGEHLNHLVGDILDWSSLQAAPPRLLLQPVSVAELLPRCLEMVRADAQAHSLNLHLENIDPDLQVLAEPRRLRQVLINLLSNAVKYNRTGGHIRLGATRVGDSLRLEVHDTGHGLDDLQQQQLFQPFQRLGRENSAIKGTGIGLVLSRELANLMGGELGVQSTLGVGSCFWIELPLAGTAASASRPRLLLLGVGEADSRLLQEGLGQQLSVRRAATIDDAVQYLLSEPTQALLIDGDLPPDHAASRLIALFTQNPDLAGLKIILLGLPADADADADADASLFNHCQARLPKPLDRDSVRLLLQVIDPEGTPHVH